MSYADAKSHLTTAANAIIAGNYASARKYVLAAEALLIAIPDGERGPEHYEFARKATDLLKELNALAKTEGSGTGIQRIKYQHEKTGGPQ
jgi:hypothetical protein